MKTVYPIEIAGLRRELPLCPVNDHLMIGAFVIFGDPELTTVCAAELIKRMPAHDVILTGESKGIPLAHEMARQMNNERYILARKGKKLYMRNPFGVEVRSITTDHLQQLFLDGADAEYMSGKRVVIVDDVISTGESLRAMEQLVEKAGGNVVGRMSILAEGEAATRNDITYLAPLPLFDGEGEPLPF